MSQRILAMHDSAGPSNSRRSGQRRAQPPTNDQIEEDARFRVMRVLKVAPQYSMAVLQMRGDEIAWLDIFNFIMAQLGQ